MKTAWKIFLILITSLPAAAQYAGRTQLLDAGWRFYRGDQPGAEQTGFNDSRWRTVDLPHDWSIEDMPGTLSPFSSDAVSGVSGGFATGGTGWYRKTLTIPFGTAKAWNRIVILFEGVYMNADVWVNGKHMGNHPYGYTSYWYDITDSLDAAGTNVVSVRVRNEGRNSRWYSGSGIYRHVWLKYLPPVHAAQWATYITTPVVSEPHSEVLIKTKLVNESGKASTTRLVTRILAPDGRQVATSESSQSIGANGETDIKQQIAISSSRLWSPGQPALYTAVLDVYQAAQLISSEEIRFGLRSISFDARNGFQLNGKTLKLKGGCIHHDNGPLGAKAFDRAEERKVELLKRSGFNALRCSHNPPSPAFLDACDRLGMLVIDESFDTWDSPKNKQDYNLYFNSWWQRDLESMVYRDRNHPSIIMWSIGNEIPHREKPEVAALAAKLGSYIRILDSTRPVTAGVNGVATDKDPYFSALDVAGYNYELKHYDSDHVRLPDRVMFATESFPLESFDYWMGVLDRSWVIGDFVWTAYDYIGEASIGWLGYPQNKDFYPWNLAYCGDIDVCGWKRPQSYYRDAFWGTAPTVSLFVKPPKPSFDRTNPKPEPWSRWNWQDVTGDWNWTGYENTPIPVKIYSNCEEVELFLNNRSLGKKRVDRSTRFIAGFTVPYEAGTLKVIGYNGGRQAARSQLVSAGRPDHIRLAADRSALKADGQDLCYITVELQDAGGHCNPKSSDPVTFSIEGPATIAGVGNADPASVESCQQPHRKAWHGRCLVILRTTQKAGKITLKATAPGIKAANVELVAK